ncbi:MAG: cardiolipin synthase ClsB [Dechloromonas sp.]|nr:MAG: cardiolipin synthase ClsB [Dechloromonas sp.]
MTTNPDHSTSLQLLHCGVDFFPHLVDAIAAARREIFLETYIFFDDTTGAEVAGALVAAARRGVAVHLMIDGFGSKEYPREKLQAMRAQGVQIRIYRPGFLNFRFLRTGLRRLHRKLAVIDRQQAYVGGINILHDFDPGCTSPRFDYAVAIRGPLVDDVLRAVTSLWSLVSWSQLRRRGSHCRMGVRPTSEVLAGENQTARLVLRDNLRNRRAVEAAYLQAIQGAKSEIVIANAYFLPGNALLQALIDAARRGVAVTLLLQGRVEYFMQHYASEFLYGRLLQAGVCIHRYQAALLHAKVAVIDGCWATVGSSNMDPFSLQLAREANLVIRDTGLIGELRASLCRALVTDSEAVSSSRWAAASIARKAMMWCCYRSLRLSQQLVTRGD